jgi:hypothetical protein
MDELMSKIPNAQCQAHAANLTSHPKPKSATRACHMQRTADSDKIKEIKNSFPSIKI